MAGYAALLLTLPLLLYQAYAFVLPAFSPTERQVALPLMVMVPFLFYAGVIFAYFLVLPAAVDFLQNFNDDNYDVLLQARDYNRFAIMVMGAMGLLFQLPVLILAVTRMGILTHGPAAQAPPLRDPRDRDRRGAAARRRPGDDAADDAPDPVPLRGLYPSRLAARPARRRALAREEAAADAATSTELTHLDPTTTECSSISEAPVVAASSRSSTSRWRS